MSVRLVAHAVDVDSFLYLLSSLVASSVAFGRRNDPPGGSMAGINNRETDYRLYGFGHACPSTQRLARAPCPNFNVRWEPSFTL